MSDGTDDGARQYWEQLARAYGGRLARDGETCPCGRPAVIVLPGGPRDLPWCGSRDDTTMTSTCHVCREPIWASRHRPWVHKNGIHWLDKPSPHGASPLPQAGS